MLKEKYNVAIIGATGNVGRELVELLYLRNSQIDNLYLVASSSSLGRKVEFGNKLISVDSLEYFDFSKVDVIFGCCGSLVSEQFADKVTKMGKVLIDEASVFRTDKDIPLIVPEVNGDDIGRYKNKMIISSPNCCAVPISLILKPLSDFVEIKRVVISTYQSVSGAGRKAMDELFSNTSMILSGESDDVNVEHFDKQIAFNVIPQVGKFDKNGDTDEETKICFEVNKILNKDIKITVTSVRVPVFIGHSFSMNIEFANNIDAKRVEEILKSHSGISVISKENHLKYATPLEIAGEDNVFVSRIRNDSTQLNTVNLWMSSDNLKKGAALNMVQIFEKFIEIN